MLALSLAAAVQSDLRSRRISNLLTVSALAAALVIRSFGGWGDLWIGLQGFGLAVFVMLPLFTLRVFGGGDAKLLIAVAAFLGPQEWLWVLFYTALAGGVMALVATVRNGTVLPALLSTGSLVKHGVTLGRSGERPSFNTTPNAVKLPYGVAIALGTAAAVLL